MDRTFRCAAETVRLESPIQDTPSRAVYKKNQDRTKSSDRRVIADMRREGVDFQNPQFYPARVPSV